MLIWVYKSVKSIANTFGLPVQDIEDALSDAYVSVSNAVSAWKYEDNWNMFWYLRKTLNNKILDKLRYKKKIGNILDSDVALLFTWYNPHIESWIDASHIEALLDNPRFGYLKALADGDRQVDILEHEGGTRSRVAWRVRRQRLGFHWLLEKHWIEFNYGD